MAKKTKQGVVLKAAGTALAFTGILLLVVHSSIVAAPVKGSRIELPGISGLGNNVGFAFNRYVLCAPYAPTNTVEDDGTIKSLDNHYLYLLDTKKPGSEPIQVDLTWFDPGDSGTNHVFYPTRVLFDPHSSTVFVRGTRFVTREGGDLDEVEVVAILRLNLDDNGKPVADQFVNSIDILGAGDAVTCSDAPLDMATSADGRYLVFTNGADLFTFNLTQGYIYRVGIVHSETFDMAKSRITYLSVDQDTNVLTVLWNRKVDDGQGGLTTESELSFYSLAEDGTISLMKRSGPDGFPAGEFLTDGSNVALAINKEKGTADLAWFVTNKGTIGQVDLRDDEVKVDVKAMGVLPELAEATDPGPRLVTYDADRRTLLIVNQGFGTQIRRPSNGTSGKIRRPSNGHRIMDVGALAAVKLSKRNKVTSTAVLPFDNEGGLTNVSGSGDGQWMFSTYSGRLFSVDSQDVDSLSATFLGSVGLRTERVDYFGTRAIVALNSFEPDEAGTLILEPGAVVLGRMSGDSAQSASFTSQAAAQSRSTPFRAPSIRRPCNGGKLK
jgi:hypothetical protein